MLLAGVAATPATADDLCTAIGRNASLDYERIIESQHAEAGPHGQSGCRWSMGDIDVRFDTSLLPSVVAARRPVIDSLTGEDGISPRATALDGIGDAASLRDRLDARPPGPLEILAVRGNRRFRLAMLPTGAHSAAGRLSAQSTNLMARLVATLPRAATSEAR